MGGEKKGRKERRGKKTRQKNTRDRLLKFTKLVSLEFQES